MRLVEALTLSVFRDVILPLLTIIASGLVASVVTFRLSAGLQRRDLLRGKLEEAYGTAHDYCMALTIRFMPYLKVFAGELNIDQANDLTIGAFKDSDHSTFRRLEMLVALYVPTAKDTLGRTVALREEMSELVREYRRRSEHGETIAPDLAPKLSERIVRLDTLEQDFKRTIVKAAMKL